MWVLHALTDPLHLSERPSELRDGEVEEFFTVLDCHLLTVADRQSCELRETFNGASGFVKGELEGRAEVGCRVGRRYVVRGVGFCIQGIERRKKNEN